MRTFMRILLPILLVAALLLGSAWYLLVYDKALTRDLILDGARYFEKSGYHEIATWLYNKAYTQGGNSEEVALELAEYYRSVGNYTKVEDTLNRAIKDGAGIQAYIALCRAYVEQDKLRDAVLFLDSIENQEIKKAIDKKRPAAPATDFPPDNYNEFIALNFHSGTNAVYVSTKDFPSTQTDLHALPVTLEAGNTVFHSVAVNKDGLVSTLAEHSFTVMGVILPVEFADAEMEKAIRDAAGIVGDGVVYTNDLWNILRFTVPANAENYSDLQYLPYLKELNVTDGKASLSAIGTLTELSVLNLQDTTVDADLFKTIAGMTGLTRLTMRNCGITTLSGLEALTELTYLDAGQNAVRNLVPLSGLTKLQTLRLDNNAVVSLNALSTLKSLTELDVSFNSVSDIVNLSQLASLKKLNLSTNLLTDISILSELKELLWLDASHNRISGVSSLADCTKLEYLDISENEVSDISAFSQLKKLEVLNFAHNTVTSLPTWSGNCALVSIDGSYNNLSSIRPLGGLANLNIVVADYNPEVSDISSLTRCSMLVMVSVYGTAVKDVSTLIDMGVVVYYNPT